MFLSIRNQIAGTVASVTTGEAMAAVAVRLDGGHDVTAAVTRDAVDDLALAPGTPVRVLVKSTEVALATGRVGTMSIRNRIPGTVSAVSNGAAMSVVRIAVAGGELTAAVTRAAADELALAEGTEVTALIKSTEISLALT
ncbi:TOBE domain-containing protein [Actinacidiphila acidipaludis]|uniref:TOBE domain-containing protein n=1 Tax=Actinacidiphila acidipaludis TaxID=2873382 RepID=A0ABS7QJ28_9ACTN|nr:TOBE domain-containing protein [Streptomyces acidipaludis]MBY8881774.1 TOBE domain-containing protein [Streptomyces acidipaludis]